LPDRKSQTAYDQVFVELLHRPRDLSGPPARDHAGAQHATVISEIIPSSDRIRLRDGIQLVGFERARVDETVQPFGVWSKYPPAEPGALVLEPLKAAYPCRSSQASLHSVNASPSTVPPQLGKLR
jgi:hypothetical protein